MSLITNRGGRTFKKNQSVYLQGHLEYGLWWKKSGRDAINKKSLRTFWKNLSNLTIVFCGNESIEILNIQKKVCGIDIRPRLKACANMSGEGCKYIFEVVENFGPLATNEWWWEYNK